MATETPEPDAEALTTAAAWLHDSYTCPREPTCTDCLAFVQSIHAYADLREVVLRTKLSEAEARIKDLGFLLPKLQARVDEAEAKLAQAEKERDRILHDYADRIVVLRTLITSLMEALEAQPLPGHLHDEINGLPPQDYCGRCLRDSALSQAREKGVGAADVQGGAKPR